MLQLPSEPSPEKVENLLRKKVAKQVARAQVNEIGWSLSDTGYSTK